MSKFLTTFKFGRFQPSFLSSINDINSQTSTVEFDDDNDDSYEFVGSSDEHSNDLTPTSNNSNLLLAPNQNVSRIEVRSCLNVLRSAPELTKQISRRIAGRDDLLNNFGNINGMVNDVFQLLNNKDIINATIEEFNNNSSFEICNNTHIKVRIHNSTELTDEEIDRLDRSFEEIARSSARIDNKTYDELLEKFKCVVCQDVCAAPVLIDCSHSFCGICLTNIIEKTGQTCPTCRCDFKSYIYERQLDESLLSDMNNLPIYDINKKLDWENRRFQYIKKLSLNNIKNESTFDGSMKYVMIPAVTIAAALVVLIMITNLRENIVDSKDIVDMNSK